jgi:hypothetical protein
VTDLFLGDINILTPVMIGVMFVGKSPAQIGNSFPCRTYSKPPAKSFICHIYEIIEVKFPLFATLMGKGRG